ncbi:MAG: hypothetical protein K2N51_12165 [Lachnospiraceae bacterium]|nr:hypothetical protein [Lachnospiraceae bacterium]
MDVFERHFNLLRKSEKIFNTYYKDNTIGIPMPETYDEDILKKGKALLSKIQAEYFRQVRSMHYWNVLDKELGDLEYLDWLVCLEERVLLVYVIPLFSRVLEKFPMLYGGNREWQVLYEITTIDKNIWIEYPKWKIYLQKMICDSVFVKDVKSSINKEYLYQFEKFIF